MLKAHIEPYDLEFAFTARTSREVFTRKKTYFIEVWDDASPDIKGVGEIPIFPSLQPSFRSQEIWEEQLKSIELDFDNIVNTVLPQNSAVRFGIECAMTDLRNGGSGLIVDRCILDNIKDGIPINGLVWMADVDTMLRQIDEKIALGFRCIKLKIGAIDFNQELELLRHIRNAFTPYELEMRVDANGAFTAHNVMKRLDTLARFDLHSIEQPLPRDSTLMPKICRESPVPVALDEDMIERWWTSERKAEWLEKIRPTYIVIKPSLVGGLNEADEWISEAKKLNIKWWVTSALESNIGLSHIAQWLACHEGNLKVTHGLGTGQIYTNNFPGRTKLIGDRIFVTL